MPSINLVKSGDFQFLDSSPNPPNQAVSIVAVRSGVSAPLSFSVSDGILFDTDSGKLDSTLCSFGLYGCGIGDVAFIQAANIGLADDILISASDGTTSGATSLFRIEVYINPVSYFDFTERTENSSKITRAQEIKTWSDMNNAVNTLINRCNSANGTNIKGIVLVNQALTGGLMSAAQYDSNITKVEAALNQIIASSEAQGLNPTNTVELYRRGAQLYPLLIWQRDSNLKTIQTVINSIASMYMWSGA